MFRNSIFRLASECASHLKVSRRCAEQILQVNASKNWSKFLRMQVVPGGCHGFSYNFEFVDPPNSDNDVVLSCDDNDVRPEVREQAKVVVDKKSLTKVRGATVDFHSELKGSAFVVIGNELVDETCACGQSFSVHRKQRPEKVTVKHEIGGVRKVATTRRATPISLK